MASRGFVFQLESVWGWQIGSVSFPPLLSSEELFSIHYGYVNLFFFKVSWLCGATCGWSAGSLKGSPRMAGWAGGFFLLRQGCSEVLPVFPARTVPPPAPTAWQVQDNLKELYAKFR